MLFLNSRPVDVEACSDTSSDYANRCAKRSQLQNITLSIVGFYLILSFVCVLFYTPISVLSLVVPILTLLITLLAIRTGEDSNIWPCAVMGIFGLLLKIIACVVFISIFDIFENTKPDPIAKKSRHNKNDRDLDTKWLFFIILTCTETFFLIISCCIKCCVGKSR
uniref:Transmembrane protein n=1 Tax=Acrobeloides nanus TaxID=290746 RepID=A0A914DQU4_9BILA